MGWNNPWQDCVRRSSVCHSDFDRLSEDGPVCALLSSSKTRCLCSHLMSFGSFGLALRSTAQISCPRDLPSLSINLHRPAKSSHLACVLVFPRDLLRTVSNMLSGTLITMLYYASLLDAPTESYSFDTYIGFVSSIHSTILLCLTHAFPFGRATTWSEEEKNKVTSKVSCGTGTCS